MHLFRVNVLIADTKNVCSEWAEERCTAEAARVYHLITAMHNHATTTLKVSTNQEKRQQKSSVNHVIKKRFLNANTQNQKLPKLQKRIYHL